MKTSNPLGRLFGKNPFTAVNEHMLAVLACVEELPALFEALECHDKDAVVQQQRVIFELEQDADRIQRNLRRELSRTTFLPFDRRDLLDLLRMQDQMADDAQDIAGLAYERYMAVPSVVQPHLRPFVDQSVRTCRMMAGIISELESLADSGLSGPDANRVIDIVHALYDQEDAADEDGIKISKALFAEEDKLDPISVVFWYRMFQMIGSIADHAEVAAEHLELMLATR